MAVKKTGESKVKKVVGGIAVALALILVGGVCGGLLQHHYKWGEEPKVEEPGGEEKPGEDSSGGGEVSTEAGVSHGIRLAAVKLASSEYEAYGVSAQAETACADIQSVFGIYVDVAGIERNDGRETDGQREVLFINEKRLFGAVCDGRNQRVLRQKGAALKIRVKRF